MFGLFKQPKKYYEGDLVPYKKYIGSTYTDARGQTYLIISVVWGATMDDKGDTKFIPCFGTALPLLLPCVSTVSKLEPAT